MAKARGCAAQVSSFPQFCQTVTYQEPQEASDSLSTSGGRVYLA